MLNTKSLGKAVGVQNQGVQDNSRLRAGQGGAVGVIVGQFKRGSLNKAFPVTIENYRARLGFEPMNPHYVAVQDLFRLGYPLVWILRVGDEEVDIDDGATLQISCDGATNSATAFINPNPSPTLFPEAVEIEVNGLSQVFALDGEGNLVDPILLQQTFPKLEDTNTGFINLSTTEPLRLRMRWLPASQDAVTDFAFTDNPTGGSSGGWATVCLAPAVQEINNCDGATDSMRFSWFGYDYELWVDGIYYPSDSNPASTIRRELSDILSSADDGSWSVINLDSVPHRIRLVRRPGGQEFDYTVSGGNDNQSFMEQPDGSLVFCLAPADADCSSTGITFEIFQSWNGMNESGYEKSIKLFDATTNELLGIGEAPIEENDGDYSNILPDFIDNLNGGNHQVTASFLLSEMGYPNGFKLISTLHRKFRLEVFVGNEGGVRALPIPETVMSDVNVDDSAASEHGAVIVNFCLQPHQGCEPVGLDTPDVSLQSGTYTINVSRDGFPTESNSMQWSGSTKNFFANILAPFIVSDENPFAYFTDGSDGTSHFQIQQWAGRIEAAGEMDVEMRDPCTLTLSGSAIEAIYGQESVEIHSCGRMFWMGV